MNFETIKTEIESFDFFDFTGGVEDTIINEASNAIALPFPPEYREFLKQLGAGGVSSEEFIGLGGADHINVVMIFNHLREPSKFSVFPESFIPIRSDGYGNYDCIDTKSPTSMGEFKIVAWLHDGGDNQVCEELSTSYWEWFLSILDMVRELDSEE